MNLLHSDFMVVAIPTAVLASLYLAATGAEHLISRWKFRRFVRELKEDLTRN